jgi:hypothetical protein
MTYLHLIDLALFIAPRRPDIIRETRETFAFMSSEVGGRERGPLLASLELEKRLAAEVEAETEKAESCKSVQSRHPNLHETDLTDLPPRSSSDSGLALL